MTKHDSHTNVTPSLNVTYVTNAYRHVTLSLMTRVFARTLEQKLKTISSLDELYGFANRRRWFPDLPKWTEHERRLILARKYELEKLYGKG